MHGKNLSRTGERCEEDESGDESSVRPETPHERVTQDLLPCAAICEPAPNAVASEAPVGLDSERCGEHTRVQDERGAEMRRKAVLRDARHRAVGGKVGPLEPGLHHVPPEGALRAQEAGHAEEWSSQGAREAPPEGEVGEGEDEGEADCAP